MGKPWLVLLTGEPGSGKTTLGRAVAHALRVPYLSRDDVRGGMLATEGLWSGRMEAASARGPAVEALVTTIEAMAAQRVSVVVEFVVVPDRAAAFDRMRAAMQCLVIVTRCRAAEARADARDRAHPLLSRPETWRTLGFDSLDAFLAAPERARIGRDAQTEFDLPTLVVDTDDGYDPSLPEIVEWIFRCTKVG